jgi:hypothetical protein
MAVELPSPNQGQPGPTSSARRHLPGLAVAAVSSVGAGAVHAAAAGMHAEHVGLTRAFVVLAALQLASGLVALVRPSRWAAVAVAAVNGAASTAWLVTRLVDISWVAGLEVREAPQVADTLCAGLGAVAVAGAVAALLVGWQPGAGARLAPLALVVAAVTVPGMLLATSHDHGHDGESVAGDEHGHGGTGEPLTAARVGTDDHVDNHGDDHDEAIPVARPFDPALPIDLGGVPGVTPEQQARAENLVAVTLAGLPRWADHRVAEAAGFRSIGDGGTGHEHFIQWDWINDDVALDPAFPESLVYEPQPDGTGRLVSAMYMLPATVGLDEVPDIGGRLMQWHIHDNLCFTTGDAPRVAALTNADGACPTGLEKAPPAPMIHVWIVPNPCGPFAALEGVGAGQTNVAENERTDRCQHEH